MLAQGKKLVFNRFTWLTLLLLFPIIDFILRNIIYVPVVSSLWDEALLLLLMGICLWRILETNRKLPSVKKPLLAFTVMGIAFLILNMHFFSINIEGFRAVFQYILAFFIGFYFLHREAEAVKASKVLIVVASLIGLYGVYQYVAAVPVPASWCDASEGVCRRSFSIVQSPNILGSYMVLMIPVAAGIALANKGVRRLFWIGLALIMLAALLFTGSRGAWLAFAGAIGLLTLFIDRRIFIAFLAVAVLSAFFVPQVKSRVANLLSPTYLEKSSNDGRINRWLNSYDQMRENPFFGAGLGRYGGAVGERHFNTTYVDSYYFKTLAETGLLGISLYIWLMVVLARNAYQVWKQQRGNRYYYFYGGIFAGLLGVMLHNGVENIFEVPFMNTFFWLLAGMLLSLPYLKQKPGKEGEVHA